MCEERADGYRLHIIGGPGSGKTHLSRLLGDVLCIPVYELDLIAGEGDAPEFHPTRPLPERMERVAEIAKEHAWITEGAFLWWTEPLLHNATAIIWLDPPRHRAVVRLVQRYVIEVVHEARRQPRLLRHPHLRPFARFVLWSWRYYDRRRPTALPAGSDPDEISLAATVRALQPYSAKVVRLAASPTTTVLLPAIGAVMGVINASIY